jgi:hypothetical protein
MAKPALRLFSVFVPFENNQEVLDQFSQKLHDEAEAYCKDLGVDFRWPFDTGVKLQWHSTMGPNGIMLTVVFLF